MASRRKEEDALQIRIMNSFDEVRGAGVVAFHVPNGGKRSKSEALDFKLMGVLPGVTDLIFLARGKAYCMELKTPKGRMSEEQERFRDRVLDAGCEWALVRNEKDALDQLTKWGLTRTSR